MNRLTATLAAALVAAVAAAPGGAWANFLTNPGFETGDFTGWTQSGDTAWTGVTSGVNTHSGTYGAEFGPVGTFGFLSQTFSAPGTAPLAITFWLRNDDGNPNAFSVSLNGGTLFQLSNASGNAYQQHTLLAWGSASGANTLTFGFRNDPAWWGLDDVSAAVTTLEIPSAVPEPASMALLGTGLLGLGLVRRRRRRGEAPAV